MLYGVYAVTECGTRETDTGQTVYFCRMVGRNDHRIEFDLIIKGGVGEKDYQAKYRAIAPYINVGDLLHCELAWQWHEYYLGLCISGFLRVKPRRIDDSSQKVSAEEFLNPQRGYWVTTDTVGEWLRFPSLIHCNGDAYVYTDFDRTPPKLHGCCRESATGKLMWRPKGVRRFVPAFLRRLFAS